MLDYADGAGLTAFAVIGSAKAMSFGVPPVPAVLMGVITGCVGGIIRDIVAGRPSVIMRPEVYVTAASLSAVLTVAGMTLSFEKPWVWGAAWLAGYALRIAAIRWNIALPSYRESAN